MPSKIEYVPLLLVLFLLLYACYPPEIKLSAEQIDLKVKKDLYAINFINENIGFASGGSHWDYGLMLSTADGGVTWFADSISNKAVYGQDVNDQAIAAAAGRDGYFYIKRNTEADWEFIKLQHWDNLQDISIFDRQNIVSVGGQAWDYGVIILIKEDPWFRAVQKDTFDFELSAVCHSSENVVHAVGYGSILRSVDKGLTWNLNQEISGDYFNGITFLNNSTGLICGLGGSILKTKDEGKHWKIIRKNTPFAAEKAKFSALNFVDETQVYIVGQEGTVWRSIDVGESWERLNLGIEEDLLDVDSNGEMVFFCWCKRSDVYNPTLIFHEINCIKSPELQ